MCPEWWSISGRMSFGTPRSVNVAGERAASLFASASSCSRASRSGGFHLGTGFPPRIRTRDLSILPPGNSSNRPRVGQAGYANCRHFRMGRTSGPLGEFREDAQAHERPCVLGDERVGRRVGNSYPLAAAMLRAGSISAQPRCGSRGLSNRRLNLSCAATRLAVSS